MGLLRGPVPLARVGDGRVAGRAANRPAPDPITRAAANRQLAIVLRHDGRHALAQELTVRAAARVEATGLSTARQSAAYAQMPWR